MNFKELARNIIHSEAESLHILGESIDDQFIQSIELLKNRAGRIVVSGIGKSALIAKKIVATLNSTGTRAIFLHAGDAAHGDLGMIDSNDIIICISKSGETSELKVIVPLLKANGIKILAMTSNKNSYLFKNADGILFTPVSREADPNNLAPTNSSIVQSAMGDAIAMVLQQENGFTSQEFALLHPGGSLGKSLNLCVGDISTNCNSPSVKEETPITQVLLTISKFRMGATIVHNEDAKIVGIITDGDIRRWYEKDKKIEAIAKHIMSTNPTIIQHDTLASEALEIMKEKKISQLPILKNKQYIGMIHLNDILREGIY